MPYKLYHRTTFNPSYIFYIALIFILLSHLSVFLIDIVNIFGIRDFIISKLEVPYFWYHWFLVPVEIPLQWYILGAAIFFFLLSAGIAYERKDKKVLHFLLILSSGLVLMLIEDAGDVRHALRHYIERFSDEITYGFYGSTFELFYFLVIASIMIYAAVKYKDIYWKHVKFRRFLILTYIFYAVAVCLSFTGVAYRAVTGYAFYDIAGEYLMNLLFISDNASLIIYENAKEYARVDFYLMDMLIEESIEFLGAAGMLTAAVAFFKKYSDIGRT